ncbi:MAG: FeoB small GTPase domain-containing protein [Gammaproteobacteria bacterium]
MQLNNPPGLTQDSTQSERSILVGLSGQPNVGKSTVFNLLTGLDQHVGNWPGKTVERKEGMLSHNGTPMRIVDLPGTYSLTANSEEERIARDFIIHEAPDVIVMIADASALERNLYLLAELLVLPVPVVLGLNMMDVAEGQGIHIEPHVLEAALGLPVNPLVAIKNQGVSQLIATAERLAQEPAKFRPTRPEIAEPHRDVLAQVRTLLNGHVPGPYQGDWIARKLLEGDTEITEKAQSWLPESDWSSIADLLKEHEDAVLDIASGRYEWIARMVRAAVIHPSLGQSSLTDRLDRIAVHPLWGLLLLLAMFGVVFWLTFTVAAPIQHGLDVSVVERIQGQEFSTPVSRIRLQRARRDGCAGDRVSKRTAAHNFAGAAGTLQCPAADIGAVDAGIFRRPGGRGYGGAGVDEYPCACHRRGRPQSHGIPGAACGVHHGVAALSSTQPEVDRAFRVEQHLGLPAQGRYDHTAGFDHRLGAQ